MFQIKPNYVECNASTSCFHVLETPAIRVWFTTNKINRRSAGDRRSWHQRRQYVVTDFLSWRISDRLLADFRESWHCCIIPRLLFRAFGGIWSGRSVVQLHALGPIKIDLCTFYSLYFSIELHVSFIFLHSIWIYMWLHGAKSPYIILSAEITIKHFA